MINYFHYELVCKLLYCTYTSQLIVSIKYNAVYNNKYRISKASRVDEQHNIKIAQL